MNPRDLYALLIYIRDHDGRLPETEHPYWQRKQIRDLVGIDTSIFSGTKYLTWHPSSGRHTLTDKAHDFIRPKVQDTAK